MKKSLHIIATSIIFCFVLSTGSANALTAELVSGDKKDEFNPLLGKNAVNTNGFKDLVSKVASPGATVASDTTSSGSSESGGAKNGGSGIAKFVPQSTARSSAQIMVTQSSLAEAVSSQAAGVNNDANEYQGYAMLLVGIGLVGLTTRRRRDEI